MIGFLAGLGLLFIYSAITTVLAELGIRFIKKYA